MLSHRRLDDEDHPFLGRRRTNADRPPYRRSAAITPTRAAIAATGPLATPQRALVFWDAKRPITAALLRRCCCGSGEFELWSTCRTRCAEWSRRALSRACAPTWTRDRILVAHEVTARTL